MIYTLEALTSSGAAPQPSMKQNRKKTGWLFGSAAQKAGGDETEPGALPLVAYVTRAPEMPLAPAPSRRQWMDETPLGFANRCLPMLMANQWGWFLLNERRLEVLWNGGPRVGDLHIHYAKKDPHEIFAQEEMLAISHFGHGILTWRIPYLIQTQPGWNLYVRGPANWCKDGACPLDGVVEADWASATFTMNWKLTRPDTWIVFEEREPVCMIFPVPRRGLERVAPEIRAVSDNPELERRYKQWRRSRDGFNRTLGRFGPGADWQKHYFRGASVLGELFRGHQTKISLREFRDLR